VSGSRLSGRPWLCPEPRCTPLINLRDGEYRDITVPEPGQSYFCWGLMAEPVTFVYDGVEHTNDANCCSVRFCLGAPPDDAARWAEWDGAVCMNEIVPLTLKEARRFVAEHHRHNEPPIGHRFSIGLRRAGELVGVVIAGHPVARNADDGLTIELVRLTTTGDRNACSRLYGAACRAAAAMGYRLAITYPLADEPGSSLRASGFTEDGATEGHEGWKHTAGPRALDRPRLFDPPLVPTGPKTRWVRVLRSPDDAARWAGG